MKMVLPDVIGHENQSQHCPDHRCLCLVLSGQLPRRTDFHTTPAQCQSLAWIKEESDGKSRCSYRPKLSLNCPIPTSAFCPKANFSVWGEKSAHENLSVGEFPKTAEHLQREKETERERERQRESQEQHDTHIEYNKRGQFQWPKNIWQ